MTSIKKTLSALALMLTLSFGAFAAADCCDTTSCCNSGASCCKAKK